MVVEDTYLYSTFRLDHLPQNLRPGETVSFRTLSLGEPNRCHHPAPTPSLPGKTRDSGYGDDGEAAIDVEWVTTAAAPNAATVLGACTDTTAFGGLIALENTLNGPAASLPSVVSISYGEAETV